MRNYKRKTTRGTVFLDIKLGEIMLRHNFPPSRIWNLDEIGVNGWMIATEFLNYDLPGIIKKAWLLATTPTNFQDGFRKTGIYLFDQNVFNETDFAPSFVTDLPMTSADVSNLA
ncbi:hypothetical protein ALC56_10563 [Trachymyrmex septentrionalis]|uniref:Uncharacterized protein n=1 Tax=Trachymyrmex septentrionalis TaxID=34720 RepID=A0A195F3Q5_9HYME|nr:hypothetical protein ALC56_10563 [Trachymyrmex septentrionalis]